MLIFSNENEINCTLSFNHLFLFIVILFFKSSLFLRRLWLQYIYIYSTLIFHSSKIILLFFKALNLLLSIL